MKVTIENIKKPKTQSAGLWLVKDESGTIIGQLERFKDSRTDTHPWKAFKGTGMERVFLRSFYLNEGGKQAAIQLIVNEHERKT